jgi:hypothetical protein
MSLLPPNEKEVLLAQRMADLSVNEMDLEETPLGAGPNAKNTSIGVVLTHRPSGLFVKCQASADKAQNRLIARRLLLDKVEVWQKVSHGQRRAMKHAFSLFVAMVALSSAALVYFFFFRNRPVPP